MSETQRERKECAASEATPGLKREHDRKELAKKMRSLAHRILREADLIEDVSYTVDSLDLVQAAGKIDVACARIGESEKAR